MSMSAPGRGKQRPYRLAYPLDLQSGSALLFVSQPGRNEERITMTSAPAAVTTWTIDPTHTIAAFTVKHLGISSFRGKFRTVEGTITLDEANPAGSSVTASIKTDSIDVPGDRFYGHMVSDDWFSAEKYPEITFRSTRVERQDDTHWLVTGDLTLHDVTRPVVLATEYLGQSVHPFSKHTVAAFHAETEIDRTDFGLNWNAAMDAGMKYVGEQVQITLDIEAVRQDAEA
jgi:polyisoprenoid-binding protein YceI